MKYMTKLFVFSSIMMMSAVLVACGDKQQANGSADQPRGGQETAAVIQSPKTILFFGNSLTAGYGLEPTEAFPSLIQKKIDSAGLNFKTVNAGVSGETSAGGKNRIDWILKTPVDIFVLELGANDGLRGIPVTETKKNLQDIIDNVKAAYPQVELVMAGMQIPPNMGARYTNDFRSMYTDLAKQNNMALIPFLLEGVGGERRFNLQDGIHPNAEGAKIVADNVWVLLQEIVEKS